jgi:hypothetical protein
LEDETLEVQEGEGHNDSYSLGIGHDSILESEEEEEYMEHYLNVLWDIDPLLSGDYVNSCIAR